VPFAVVIGAVQALNALNADSERAVIDAAGARRLVVANPILLLGLIGALIVLVNSHVVGPRSSAAFQDGIRSINANALTLFLQPGRFEQIQRDLVVSIEDAQGSQIEGLFLADSRDPTVELQYLARRAQVVDQFDRSFLVLQDGQLQRRVVEGGELSIIEFETYAFDLSTLRPVTGDDWIRMSERSTAELLRPDPNDRANQTRPDRYVEEITARRTDWLYPIAFAFWAVVVAGHPRTNRQGAGPTMLIALGGALFLKAIGFVSLSLIGTDVRLAFVAYLVPAASIALSIALYVTGLSVIDLPVVQRIGYGFERLAEVFRRIARPRTVREGRA
jgi:lipopolysaccharide export system permease protein